jgi:hypothetical protein
MGMQSSNKKKPWARAVIWGGLSIVMYAALLLYQEPVIDYFGRGGLFALLPIGVAFLFSYVHGSFTGSFWSVMGIEASKKKEAR